MHVLVWGLLGVGQAKVAPLSAAEGKSNGAGPLYTGEGWNVHPTLQKGSFIWGRVKINDQVPT